jgi:hypothetical protein
MRSNAGVFAKGREKMAAIPAVSSCRFLQKRAGFSPGRRFPGFFVVPVFPKGKKQEQNRNDDLQREMQIKGLPF